MRRSVFFLTFYLTLLSALGSGIRARAIQEAPAPAFAFYHPDAPDLFTSLDGYLEWYKSRRKGHIYDPAKLTLGVYFHIATYDQKNHAHVDALVRAIETKGHNVVVHTGRGDAALASAFMRNGQPAIDALLFGGERLSLSNHADGLAEARALNVPILQALNHFGMDARQFAASPTGLHPEMTPMVVFAEQDGLIEPIVIAGKGDTGGARPPTAPFPAQVEWRVERALAWARLHRTTNASKRVVFTYWSEGGGKANTGGDPDDFLDVQATLVRLLGEMKARGYNIGAGALPDRDALTRRMALEASNVGTWANGELAGRVKRGEVTLIPEDTYRAWFEALPAARRREMIDMWGPPPGKIMVFTDGAGKRSLVIPTIQFGNILIAPHPDWGYLQDNKALMSVGALPPHHQYVAFFLWLQHTWRADAWVSLFSNIVLQPGKAEGPAADDHVALLLGGLPHIHPERLGSNGGISNKRKGMAQTVGWYNLITPSDAGEQLAELRARLGRYEAQPDPTLRTEAEALIREEIVRTGLNRALDINAATAPFPALKAQLLAYLAELDRAHVPHGTKILGDSAEGSVLADMVTGMLGADFRMALTPAPAAPAEAARRIVRAVVLEGRTPADAITKDIGSSSSAAESLLAHAIEYAERLRGAPREVSGILDSLEGRWIEPGPMEEPLQKPDSVPPGRSLYNFDQAAMPTAEAERIGIRQADALIAAHREKHDGAYPRQQAFVVWSSEIARNHGVTEAQILHLLGTRVVRNPRGEVTGVQLIPREELGRPRVDVLLTISGVYRDHYLDKVDLLAEAVRLASSSPEPDNPVAAATRATEVKLQQAGETAARAASFAAARIFSEAPGAYSPSIQFLAKSGDQRGDEAKMADLYTSRVSHIYGAGLYGAPARSAFESNLARVDGATLPRSSNVNGLLDQPASAAYLGGLNLAARAVTGRDVDLYVSNLSDPSNPVMESAARALQTEMRTRYFNPKWLAEMKAHGYDGARNMMFFTDHLDLWASTTGQMVGSADWAEVKSIYVDDKLGLDLDTFFDRYNPHAQQVLLGNLLGAASRGQWNANAADLAQVAGRLARSASDHGAVCEANICRNPALTAAVETALANAPGGPALSAQYRSAIDRITSVNPADFAAAPGVFSPPAPVSARATPANPNSAAAAPPAAMASSPAPLVTGRALEAASPPTTAAGHLSVVGAIALALVAAGWLRPGLRSRSDPR